MSCAAPNMYCFCPRGLKGNDEGDMVLCDACDVWYHCTCVRMPKKVCDGLDQWHCPLCLRAKRVQESLMLKFKEEVSTLKCEFASMKASLLLNVERQALAQKNDSAALKQFHSQDKSLANLQREVERSEAEVKKLQSTLKARDATIKDLESTLQQVGTDIQDVVRQAENRFHELLRNSDVKKLRSALQVKDATILELETTLQETGTSNQEVVEQMEIRYREMESNFDQAQATIKQLKNDIVKRQRGRLSLSLNKSLM